MSLSSIPRTHGRRTLACSAAIAIAMTTGCGTRVSHERLAAAGNQLTTGAGVVPGAVQPSGSVVPGSQGVPAAGTDGALPVNSSSSDSATSKAGAARVQSGTAASSGVATDSGAPQSVGKAGAPTSAGSACTRQLSPVVLGQTLAASGLIGASTAQMRDGLAIWAKDVNSRGGVECHPVKLFQLDDGSDPSRVSSNFNELVNDRKAVAIVGAGVPVAIAALRSSAERAKVPVVGGDLVTPDWNESRFLFPQGGTASASYRGAIIEAVRATPGAKVAGLIYCVEASVCTQIKNEFPAGAKQAGVATGPIKSTSIAQSDYTAECQTLKDGKAEVAFFAVDGSAATRMARNCASQGYRPTIISGSTTISNEVSKDPNLRQNKVFLGANVAPFTESDTPGGKDFQEAMKRYGARDLAQSHMQGWTAGKLFEAAMARVSAKARAGDITTALVLEALWQVKNETLDGLAPGVSFQQGAPAPRTNCYYAIRLDTNGFSAPNKSAKRCPL